MVKGKRIDEVHGSSGGIKSDGAEFTHEEAQNILLTHGYDTVEVEMLVDVNHTKSSAGGECRSIGNSTELRPVFLCLKAGQRAPFRDQHLNDHRDKWYFKVVYEVLHARLVKLMRK